MVDLVVVGVQAAMEVEAFQVMVEEEVEVQVVMDLVLLEIQEVLVYIVTGKHS